jgi:signal transduction histidine kinase
MKSRIVVGILIVLSIASAVYLLLFRSQMASLPYEDRFSAHKASEWTVMGGNWNFDGNAVVNRSDEHGAKLITGSAEWGDVALDVDLKLIGHAGDVGVMIRANDAEPGADAYNGYYVGLRSDDQALVMGRADHGWMEGRPTVMEEGGIVAGRWYHLHVVAQGCAIGARAVDTTTEKSTWGLLEEKNCVLKGRIGLRSMATGGAWKHVVVKQASSEDFASIRSHASFIQTPKFVFREADLNQSLRDSSDPDMPTDRDDLLAVTTKPVTTIEAVKLQGSGRDVVVLRGVVTLVDPLYIQDSTGGIAVESSNHAVLNLGDEVELRGVATNEEDRTNFLATTIKLRGDRTLLPPASVTSTQAAGVLFDGKLAELRARLLGKSADSEGHVTLQLEDSAQTFRAVGSRGLSGERFENLLPGSELRIRGVCRVGPWQGKEGGAFTILMRSMEDAEVVSGPPWWSTRLLIREMLLLAFLIALGIYIYLRVERAKMRAIIHERERLAHEMHDTLAQSFAGVGFHLQGVRNSARSGSMTMPAVIEKLTFACDLVARTHRDASSEIAALHPGTNDDADLLTMLERCAYTMLDGSHLPIQLNREGTPHAVSLAVRDALFHIGRESIANILRHAKANTIALRIRYEFRSVILEICDDGCGLNYNEHANDFGFRGMHRRSEAVGASLEIISKVNQGTCVRVKAPYNGRRRAGKSIRSRASSTQTGSN